MLSLTSHHALTEYSQPSAPRAPARGIRACVLRLEERLLHSFPRSVSAGLTVAARLGMCARGTGRGRCRASPPGRAREALAIVETI